MAVYVSMGWTPTGVSARVISRAQTASTAETHATATRAWMEQPVTLMQTLADIIVNAL